MNWRDWKQYLFPKEGELDRVFRQELWAVSMTGLRAIAAVGVGASLLIRLVGILWVPELIRTSPI